MSFMDKWGHEVERLVIEYFKFCKRNKIRMTIKDCEIAASQP